MTPAHAANLSNRVLATASSVMQSGCVLVVDDDPAVIRALTMRLGAAGFQVLAAEDGVAAMTLAALRRPDVIILDIGLPGHDGYVVVTQLRASAATADIPVIFLTGRTTSAEFQKAQAAGVAGYFVKPYRSDELLSKVYQVMGN